MSKCNCRMCRPMGGFDVPHQEDSDDDAPVTKFRIGDTVEWTSQSAGTTKTKRGTVVAALPPGKGADEWVKDCGIARDEETYVIAVRTHGEHKRRVRYYWPSVARLKLVAAGEEAIT